MSSQRLDTLANLVYSSSIRGDERGFGPALAVVMLLAVTIVLGLVGSQFILGSTDDVDRETPDADFSFLYEQTEGADTTGSTDDFGTATDAGEGLVTINYDRGDALDPANVEVSADTSGGNLLTDTSDGIFASGERLQPGDSITLAAERGETVELVWNAADGEEGAVIGTTDIDGTTGVGSWGSTPLQVPSADDDCGYIEEQIDEGAAHNDINISGVIVECDLTQYYPRIDDIKIQSDSGDLGALIGELNGTGDVTVDDGATYQGTVDAGTDGSDGDVYVKSDSVISSDIAANKNVDVDGQSEVHGEIEAGVTVSVQTSSWVEGPIRSGTAGGNGDVDVSGSNVGGDIVADGDGDVDLTSGSFVDGAVEATGYVSVQGGSTLEGGITSGTDGSGGTVQVSGSEVGGDIVAESAGVDVDSDSTVRGSIEADGDVSVQGGIEVYGGITSGLDASNGDIQLSGSAVSGDIDANGNGTVSMYNGSSVDGGINATGLVSLSGGSSVATNVTAIGDITLGSSTAGRWLVSTAGNIDISSAEVGGHAKPDGSFSCSSSTINGQNCSEYTPKG